MTKRQINDRDDFVDFLSLPHMNIKSTFQYLKNSFPFYDLQVLYYKNPGLFSESGVSINSKWYFFSVLYLKWKYIVEVYFR